MINLEDKFSNGLNTHTYQRISPDYNTDVFVGYNDDGKMSMIITENGSVEKVRPSKEIDVQLNRRKDGKLALSFDLLDNEYSSLFVVFCKDMVFTCEKYGKQKAISSAVRRWKYWKMLFGERNIDLLGKQQVKGLIGELIILKDYFIEKIGAEKAITSWMGPVLGHKDFEIADTWCEVKSISEAALQVSISSLEQLESELDGHLAIVRLEDTNELVKDNINLNKLVTEIMGMLGDPDILDEFNRKLNFIGYKYDPRYDKINFVLKNVEFYCVNDKFPRLRRNYISSAIGNANYTILLDGIHSFCEG